MSIQSFTDKMKKLGVHVSNVKTLNLLIAKYIKGECNFSDPLTNFCRGFVLNADTLEPVMVPPEKSQKFPFFLQNVGENWSEVIIEEFIDGTMINVFYFEGVWYISTRSAIGGWNHWTSAKNFSEMFNEAKGGLDLEKLNPKLTYSFVLRHPENRIVTKYEIADLVLVQVRQVYIEIDTYTIAKTLKEIGIEVIVPKRYTHSTLESVLNQIASMNYQEQGLVFKYGGVRTKLRNEEYNTVKRMKNGDEPNLFMNYLKLRRENQIKAYLSYFPEHDEQFKIWRDQIHSMTQLLWNNYQNNFITRDRGTKVDWKSIPFELRKHVHEIHTTFREKKTEEATQRRNGPKFKINFDFVKSYFNRLDDKRIIWIVNFRQNYVDEEGFYAHKKETTVETTVEPVETTVEPVETTVETND